MRGLLCTPYDNMDFLAIDTLIAVPNVANNSGPRTTMSVCRTVIENRFQIYTS